MQRVYGASVSIPGNAGEARHGGPHRQEMPEMPEMYRAVSFNTHAGGARIRSWIKAGKKQLVPGEKSSIPV